MSLPAGTTLAHYEILEPIGKGGMGEVYRAQDGKLGRDVAIKVLPDEFAQDEERLRRFQREAKVLASLNHPNIAAIYGLEHSGESHYLVLELVPGETLADRIARGPIPVGEALEIAKKIAEALEEAHEQGLVHRDLKPANVKLTPDDKVKVLDFGLAKAFAEEGPEGDPATSISPTITRDATRVGVILGTAAYMSPEQAKGKSVDKRSDIFSFGAVLYEMLTRKKAFAGEDVSDVLASIIKLDIDWKALSQDLDPRIKKLLSRCLRLDRKTRLRDIGDVRNEIEEIRAEPVSATTAGTKVAARRSSVWRAVLLTAVATALATGIIAWVVTRLDRASSHPATRFTAGLPSGVRLDLSGIALSPNGRELVYSGVHEGVVQLYRRSMDRLESVPIDGTEQARYPFFSPDGEWIGFFADAKLKKVSLAGGSPITLCDAGTRRGASWGSNEVIVFASDASPGLMKVSASGGAPEPVTIPGEGASQHRWLDLMPEASAVLFTLWSGNMDTARIAVESLETGERKVLVAGTDPRYVSTGHILFGRANTIWAIPFDSDRLEVTGEATPVVENVQVNPGGLANFAPADDGSLIYVPSDAWVSRNLVWVDREGKEELVAAEPQAYQEFALSPDGTQLAVRITDASTSDLWIYDLVRGTRSRLTFEPDITELSPVWTPDGERVVFGGFVPLSWKAADGTGDVEPLIENSYRLEPQAFSRDGSLLLLVDRSLGLGDLTLLPLQGERVPSPLLGAASTERNAVLSPDGRWMAYESSESGRFEVYVRPFPNVEAGQWQVSSDGGAWPVWAPSGREIFYVGSQRMMRVVVETEPAFGPGLREPLFETAPYDRIGSFGRRGVAMAPDGRRFLMLKEVIRPEGDATPSIIVVQNWHEELKRLVPVE